MQRFVCVTGLPGVLVPHPDTTGKRFAGQREKGWDELQRLAQPVSLVERYEPCTEVVRLDAGVLKALKRGDLLGGDCVVAARNAGEAAAKLMPATAAKKKTGAPGGSEK